MGAQPTKERSVSAGPLTARVTRSKPRHPKDARQHGSNIFTEHSGKFNHISSIHIHRLRLPNIFSKTRNRPNLCRRKLKIDPLEFRVLYRPMGRVQFNFVNLGGMRPSLDAKRMGLKVFKFRPL